MQGSHSFLYCNFFRIYPQGANMFKKTNQPKVQKLEKDQPFFYWPHGKGYGFKVRKVYQNQPLVTRMIIKKLTSSQKIVHLCLICYHLIVILFSSFYLVLSSSLLFHLIFLLSFGCERPCINPNYVLQLPSLVQT